MGSIRRQDVFLFKKTLTVQTILVDLERQLNQSHRLRDWDQQGVRMCFNHMHGQDWPGIPEVQNNNQLAGHSDTLNDGFRVEGAPKSSPCRHWLHFLCGFRCGNQSVWRATLSMASKQLWKCFRLSAMMCCVESAEYVWQRAGFHLEAAGRTSTPSCRPTPSSSSGMLSCRRSASTVIKIQRFDQLSIS